MMQIQGLSTINVRSSAALLIALCFLLSACSSNDDDGANSVQAAEDTAMSDDTESEGTETEGTETGGTETGGTETGGAETGGAETGGAETEGTETEGAETEGAEPEVTGPIETERPDTSAVSGLWDARVDTSLGTDEMFKLISEDGIVTTYDYQQDPVGSGANCYTISSTGLNPEGGSSYSIGNRQFTMLKQEDVLSVMFVDVDDVDRDEDFAEVLEQAWPAVDGVDTMDLNSCGI